MSEIRTEHAHPNREALKQYQSIAPVGEWVGRLDHLAWGSKAGSLFCYFTNAATDQKVRLAVFSNRDYKPYKNRGKSMCDESLLGKHFKITTGVSRSSGFPTFLKAKKTGAPASKL